ncbi:MAG: hypothetical protein HWE14_11190 [Flavobacteriia bacterium]|nr:hypothetical protein [Flavobacteriia bacterium]
MRVFKLLSVAILAVALTGCFEIKQTVSVNSNGSGNYDFSFSFGEMGAMLAARAEANGEKFSMKTMLDTAEGVPFTMKIDQLAAIDGIDNVRSYENDEGTELHVSFDFENMDALNAGANLMIEDTLYDGMPDMFVQKSRREFAFTGYSDLQAKMAEAMGEDADSNMQMMMMMFQDMAFITEVKFEGKVDELNNDDVLMSGNRKGVVLRYRPFNSADMEMETAFKVKLED